jgi:hypothetical protein
MQRESRDKQDYTGIMHITLGSSRDTDNQAQYADTNSLTALKQPIPPVQTD